jgi:hypothetical protein
MQRPTAEEIKAYQKETGEGVAWCKEQLTKQYARDAIRRLPETINPAFDAELKEILMYLLNK